MKCFNCKGETFETVEGHEMKTVVDGIAYTATCPVFQCCLCANMLIDGDNVERFDDAVNRRLAKYMQVGPDALKRLLSAGDIKGKDAAELLDVTATTVSRWVNGRAPIPKAAFIVIAVIALEMIENGCSTTHDDVKFAQPEGGMSFGDIRRYQRGVVR